MAEINEPSPIKPIWPSRHEHETPEERRRRRRQQEERRREQERQRRDRDDDGHTLDDYA